MQEITIMVEMELSLFNSSHVSKGLMGMMNVNGPVR